MKFPKSLIPLILFGILFGVVAGTALQEYLHPMTAEVATTTLSRTLAGTPLADDEAIDWGLVEPDSTYSYENLTVTNTGNTACNVTLWHNAPAGWSITWTANNTHLEPAQSAEAPLELYVAASATEGVVYKWNSYVRAITP